ncbi:MAG: PEP-CTERM sorting domain-containing protein, partial [Bryobacteraceae bacterium]
EAYGIDNNGDIVGAGVFNGVQYAVELIDPPSGGPSGPTQQTPQSPVATPEPLSALLMGGGLVAAGVLFRRKRKSNSKLG